MAFNEELAERIRLYIGTHPKITEKKMFGGLTFLLDGKMTVGIIKNNLMVRIVAKKIQAALEKDFVNEMKFTGKAMKEFLDIEPEGFKTNEELQKWIEIGIEHAELKLKNKK